MTQLFKILLNFHLIFNFISVCVPDELAKMKKSGTDGRLPNFECLKIFYIWYLNRDRLTLPNLLCNSELCEIIEKPDTIILGPADILNQQNYMRFLRLRGIADFSLDNGQLVARQYSGDTHALCDTITILPLNAPKTLVNCMSCDFCLMRFCDNSASETLLESGISRQITIIQNLKRQSLKNPASGAFSVNKLMNSVIIELQKIDRTLSINIAEIPKYRIMQVSQQIAKKNTFSKGTIGCLTKIGKTWTGLHFALSRFNEKKQFCFDVTQSPQKNVSLNETGLSIVSKGGLESDPNRSDFSCNNPLDSNIFALGDLHEQEKWPELASGNPTNDEKQKYIDARTSTRNEILQLKHFAEQSFSASKNDEERISPLLMIEETTRALSDEELNHKKQINKMRRFDIESVEKAVKYAGSITLVDEISRPDALLYPEKFKNPPTHTNISREIIHKLFSRLEDYEKTRHSMQTELEKRAEEIDNICSALTNIIEPDINSPHEGLTRIYAKMRNILTDAGHSLDPLEDSRVFDLGEVTDKTWDPKNTSILSDTSVTTCSFDASLGSNESADSFIFPVNKKRKVIE